MLYTALLVFQGILVSITVYLVVAGLVTGLRKRYRDRKWLRTVERKDTWTRHEIAEGLRGLSTSIGRTAFVALLDELRVTPDGLWPDGELPNYGHDAASIRLAQMEEDWLGLGGQG